MAIRRIVAAALMAAVVPIAGEQQSEAPQRPRLTGISHVAFRVTDPKAARQFYTELIGLTERSGSRDGRTIFTVGDHQFLQLEAGLPAGDDERLSHVAFGSPDVKGLGEYLTSRGLQVRQPPERCFDTAIRVRDRDGHQIEFVQVKWPEAATADAGRALSNRLLHAGVIVGDEGAAHTFYRDILGFSEIWRGGRREGTTDWINMRVPDGTDYLEYMLNAPSPDRRQRGVLHHVCLRVADIQTAWETVAARSAAGRHPLPAPPSVGRNGRWQLNLFDPDGTRVELMEPFTIR